ncbi:MAG: hypothetical protein GXO79_16810 [Chlorobi bacterium]|nr:hypothetical protein [Chlorobiota bacterium]
MKIIIILFCFYICFTSCIHKKQYHEGFFPEEPVNMEDINSVFDDYNSASPILGKTFPLCFSSNRKTLGDNYDIIYKLISVEFSKDNGTLDVNNLTYPNYDIVNSNDIIYSALPLINTNNNELGPNIMSFDYEIYPNGWNYYNYQFLILYANDESGNLNIKFTHNFQSDTFAIPENVSFLNTEFDDAYPSFNQDFTKIYFTSNRDGKFDIYTADFEKSDNIVENLKDSLPHIIKIDSILSSASDDKCPYIFEDFMVFTSNREGGFGGFDLYFSRFENGQWSTPTNFGNKINTEYDEYRPLVKAFYDFKNDFMIFSSNRPGGKGGFDLYYVGIEKINPENS